MNLAPADDALLSILFTLRDPKAPKNYRPTGRGNKLPFEALRERERIHQIALIARERNGWPTNTYVPRRVRLTLQAYDGRWDSGAFDAFTRDSLQRVLYYDDRIVDMGAQMRPILDGRGRRLVVMVELLEIWSPAVARQLEAEVRARADRYAAQKDRRNVGAVREQLPLSQFPIRRRYGIY